MEQLVLSTRRDQVRALVNTFSASSSKKSGPAKNLSTESERLTLSCGITLAWSYSGMELPWHGAALAWSHSGMDLLWHGATLAWIYSGMELLWHWASLAWSESVNLCSPQIVILTRKTETYAIQRKAGPTSRTAGKVICNGISTLRGRHWLLLLFYYKVPTFLFLTLTHCVIFESVYTNYDSQWCRAT